VIKLIKCAALSLMATLLLASPAFAQEAEGTATGPSATAAGGFTATQLSGAVGAGLVCIGSAYGIGKLAAAALESMARQPEVAGNIQVAMIIAAALIEGFTFYALFICSTQNPWGAAG
jgi:F-type H+-transporting ATPase subunit c